MMKQKRALDLRGIYCPLNMVKTRLAMEKLEPGEEMEIHFDDEGSLANVSKGLEKEGHTVQRIKTGNNNGTLLVEKR